MPCRGSRVYEPSLRARALLSATKWGQYEQSLSTGLACSLAQWFSNSSHSPRAEVPTFSPSCGGERGLREATEQMGQEVGF